MKKISAIIVALIICTTFIAVADDLDDKYMEYLNMYGTHEKVSQCTTVYANGTGMSEIVIEWENGARIIAHKYGPNDPWIIYDETTAEPKVEEQSWQPNS